MKRGTRQQPRPSLRECGWKYVVAPIGSTWNTNHTSLVELNRTQFDVTTGLRGPVEARIFNSKLPSGLFKPCELERSALSQENVEEHRDLTSIYMLVHGDSLNPASASALEVAIAGLERKLKGACFDESTCEAASNFIYWQQAVTSASSFTGAEPLITNVENAICSAA